MGILLRNGGLSAQLRPQGGALTGSWFEGQPFLSPPVPGMTACFPLVPFGNRVAGNRFSFHGRDHVFQPNSAGNPLYLHGDGWLGDWTVTAQSPDRAALRFARAADAVSPYAYVATQEIALDSDALSVTLSVTNAGKEPLPFGIGLHPFFPKTASTRLYAPAQRMWSEEAGHLPGTPGPVPIDVDFTTAATLPARWINNAFEGWDGAARIEWPEQGLCLAIEASSAFRHYMLYQPEAATFFCVEPMSHLPNGHHLPQLGGLTVLRLDETVSGTVTFRPMRM